MTRPPHKVLKILPSFLRNILVQSVISRSGSARYEDHHQGHPIVLVPGMFCIPNALKRLGAELQALGFRVFTPDPFPRLLGFCNIGPAKYSVDNLMEYLADLSEQERYPLTIVGHSLGGVIALAAATKAKKESIPLNLNGIVTMGSPIDGKIPPKLARLIPACNDVHPDSDIIKQAQESFDLVKVTLIAEKDILLTRYEQSSLYLPKRIMKDFQHMDFYAGTDEKVQLTAKVIAEYIL